MSAEQYHITNGDSLSIPETLPGHIVVCRECMVDGDVGGDSFQTLIETRARFMHKQYQVPLEEYNGYSLQEFDKMRSIPDKSIINLWFEKDLFCQVNLWFVISLLQNKTCQVHLVLPTASLEYGFGGMDDLAKTDAFKKRTFLSDREMRMMAALWDHYRNNDLDQLLQTASDLKSRFPFVLVAAQAHADRFNGKYQFGRPEEVLREIMKNHDSHDFGTIFREFNKLQPVYGFGDLQVRRIMDHILLD